MVEKGFYGQADEQGSCVSDGTGAAKVTGLWTSKYSLALEHRPAASGFSWTVICLWWSTSTDRLVNNAAALFSQSACGSPILHCDDADAGTLGDRTHCVLALHTAAPKNEAACEARVQVSETGNKCR